MGKQSGCRWKKKSSQYRRLLRFFFSRKVAVNANVNDLRAFLNYLVKSTNMKCLTPDKVCRSAPLSPQGAKPFGLIFRPIDSRLCRATVAFWPPIFTQNLFSAKKLWPMSVWNARWTPTAPPSPGMCESAPRVR
jgi:hypothetical protein